MTDLRKYLDSGRLTRQRSSPAEIESLFKVVERDLADASVSALSTDRRFATAYNAALQLATIVLRAEGYRTSGAGHHWITFVVLPQILGAGRQETADFLDACRARRNTVDYDGIGIASDADVAELIAEARSLREVVETWLAEKHGDLLGGVAPM
jgi:hypothetical protein